MHHQISFRELSFDLLKLFVLLFAISAYAICTAPAHAANYDFLDNTTQVTKPTWLDMNNGTTALNSTAAQGVINNSSNRMTAPQTTYNPLTSATPVKLPLPAGPTLRKNNLLAPDSVGRYGQTYSNALTPPPWDYIAPSAYTYGFPTNSPAIPGGIYKGQDFYLPPTSTASVDLNVVDRSGTQYPLLPSIIWYATDPNNPGPHPDRFDPKYDTLADLQETKAAADQYLEKNLDLTADQLNELQ